MTDLLPFDSSHDTRGMVRERDRHTAREAARAIAPKRTALHQQVIEAFKANGPMTDEQLEQLPQFAGYGPSTIRKRRSELFQQGIVILVGDTVNHRRRSMFVWNLSVTFLEASE